MDEPYFAERDAPVSPTRRALDCLRCASYGLDLRQTADALGIQPDTVNQHLDRARLELRAKTTTHAVAIALRLGLID